MAADNKFTALDDKVPWLHYPRSAGINYIGVKWFGCIQDGDNLASWFCWYWKSPVRTIGDTSLTARDSTKQQGWRPGMWSHASVRVVIATFFDYSIRVMKPCLSGLRHVRRCAHQRQVQNLKVKSHRNRSFPLHHLLKMIHLRRWLSWCI